MVARCRNKTYPILGNALELDSVLNELDAADENDSIAVAGDPETNECWMLLEADYRDEAEVEFWV